MSEFRCTGVVLMGGQSSRMAQMKTPKHDLVLPDGRTMIGHVIAAVQSVCSRVVLVGGPQSAPPQRYTMVRDARPSAGPLGGIEALLASGIDSQYLVCPCDVPLMSPQVLRVLLKQSSAHATIVRIADRVKPESLPARLSAQALPTVRTLLDSGQRAVWALMQALPADVVQISGDWTSCFQNVNTPDDWHAITGSSLLPPHS